MTNIILFIVDNMCPWPLGCYGNPDAYTPNLDRMAAQGIQFNNFYCANALCSPARASLLTGLMPSAHGIHTPLPDTEERYPQGWNAIEEFETLPKVLKANGYNTAMIGKYHLGDFPTKTAQGGFDYWSVKSGGHTRDFWHNEYYEDGERHEYNGHATELWTQKALNYLHNIADDENPFFMVVSYNPPYGTSQCLDYEINGEYKNPFWERFEHKKIGSIPKEPVANSAIKFGMTLSNLFGGTPAFLQSRNFMEDIRSINNLPRYRNLFSQISYLDDGIGRILLALQKLGLDQETIVLFTADHGHSYGQNGIWGTGWHTLPGNGHRYSWNIPLIMRYPGYITPGQETDLMVMQTDLFSTLLDLVKAEYAPNALSPGTSLAPLLRGERLEGNFDTVYYEMHETRAMRTREWLYVKHFDPQYENELFDLMRDPGEHRNVIANPAHAAILAEMDVALTKFFDDHAAPEYDVWQGGTMKASVIPDIDEAPFKAAYGHNWQPIFPEVTPK